LFRKSSPKKVKKSSISTFVSDHQSLWLLSFWGELFGTFPVSLNSIKKTLLFKYPIEFWVLRKQIFPVSTFWNFKTQPAKRLEMDKHLFKWWPKLKFGINFCLSILHFPKGKNHCTIEKHNVMDTIMCCDSCCLLLTVSGEWCQFKAYICRKGMQQLQWVRVTRRGGHSYFKSNSTEALSDESRIIMAMKHYMLIFLKK
jgi:hypothetical protein